MVDTKPYVGIPFKHMGRTLEGLDCWGLVKMVFKDVRGVDLWDPGQEYPPDWSKDGADYFMENWTKQWERVEEPAELDLLILHTKNGKANHVGVMIDSSRFLHCPKAGVVIGTLANFKANSLVEGYFRFKEKAA